MNRHLRRLLCRISGCALALLSAAGGHASVTAQLVAPNSATQGPAKLELRLGGGRKQFHLGELIPIEFILSSSEHRKYVLSEDCTPQESYQYKVPPEFVDRIVELDAAMSMYLSGIGCHGVVGAGNEIGLFEKPLVIKQLLNERYRMDTPGRYQILATVNRLGFPLASNEAELEILPGDASWEEAEAKRAQTLIDSSAGSTEWQEGCRVLRFLGTERAELEMARLEAAPIPCGFAIALINAKHRKVVLAELEKGLTQPDRAISEGYLRTLAFLSLYEQHPEWYPALSEHYDFSAGSPQNSGLWRQRGVAQAEQIRYAHLLADSLPAKTPEARALSIRTLTYLGRALNGAEIPEDLRTTVREQVPEVLAALPDSERGYLLLQEWEQIKSPAMLAALRDLVEKRNWYGRNGIALRRLYELAPEDARPIILNQLRSDTPQGSVGVLSLLNEKTLPELDTVMLQRVQRQQGDGSLEFSAGLLQRYASPAVADQLRPWFTERIGKMWCGAEANLLAYFFRVAPAEGAGMLQKAMLHNDGGCSLLMRLARVRMSREVEEVAVAALHDARPLTFRDGLQVLQCYGSPASRPSMLQQFRQWHDQWVPQAKLLEFLPGSEEKQRQEAYLNAVGYAHGWLTSKEDWQALRELCVTNSCKETAQRAIDNFFSSQGFTMIGFREPVGDEFTEEMVFPGSGCWGGGTTERLKEKIMQYPKGSIFKIDTRGKEKTRVQRIYAELKPLFDEHGFDLQLYRE